MLIFLCAAVWAAPRGLTTREVPVSDAVDGIAVRVFIPGVVPARPVSLGINRDEWTGSDSLDLGIRLQAGQQYGLQFHPATNSVSIINSLGDLLPQSQLAIAKAPSWLRADLISTLAQCLPARQELWAQVINAATDPYVDEIAFCVAYSSPEYLNSQWSYPQLFSENASFIYSIAAELPYVEVLDSGSSAGGGNYYSTTRYWRKDANGVLEQISVPPDIYYWHLVHPKITDEIPAYIDPAIVENNNTHTNNIAPPPTGKFWREYIYNLDDGTHPVLSDTLSLCQTLFNRDGSGGDAIRTIIWWINQNMSFTSNSERPHQPVRIIAKRFGRCGEYADLTAAVSRLALIPCTSISSVSTDHTWNEFWESDWVSWEPVNGYVNNPLVYENGWGKVFGSVFETRSDGLMTPVTGRYSDGESTISIRVVDANSYPVDGARVILAIVETTPRFDTEGYTDNDGWVHFSVGDARNYRGRAETSFGLYPANPGTYTQLVENSVDGETYQYIFQIAAPMPQPVVEQLPPPADTVLDYRFGSDFTASTYYVRGKTLWDDIDIVGTQPCHYREVDQNANTAFLVTDADNFLFYQIDHFGAVYSYIPPAASGSALFDIVDGQQWYAFVDNSHRHGNAVHLNGMLRFESGPSPNDDPYVPATGMVLHPSVPNPASGTVTWRVDLARAANIEAAVYNIRGQKVWEIHPGAVSSGTHSIVWDGTDASGDQVPAGIYLVRVASGDGFRVRKVLMLRK